LAGKGIVVIPVGSCLKEIGADWTVLVIRSYELCFEGPRTRGRAQSDTDWTESGYDGSGITGRDKAGILMVDDWW
jgi:hypothetical protein